MDKRTREILKKRNVVSVGIGKKVVDGKDTGRVAVVVGVIKKVPLSKLKPKDVVPKTVEGRETDVVEIGEIKALAEEEIDRKARWRPAPGGVSIGHKDITAGTLGCLVKKDGNWLILSNNHVLANVNEAEIGDDILQPGPYDGGALPGDRIGKLADLVKIEFGTTPPEPDECPIARSVADVANFFAAALGSRTRLIPYREPADNLVDCALALPDSVDDVERKILECEIPVGFAEPEIGMKVKKSGRTTGLTQGEVTQVEAAVNVNMGEGRYAYFVDQFLISGDFSKGGDSGSLIMTEDDKAAGLLFAGSDTITVGNRFTNVKEKLGFALE